MGWFGGDKPATPRDPNAPRGGILGALDRARAKAKEKAKADADALLLNTTPVAPPATSLLASTNTNLANTAAERTRKRAAGGALLLNTPATPGPKATLAPKNLLGY